jgi:hypothetical protein
MELNTAALVGLACFLANSPNQPKAITDSLDTHQRAQIVEIIESNTCLPRNFELLLGAGDDMKDNPSLECKTNIQFASDSPSKECGGSSKDRPN